jgi:RNA polymerase sigma-70 factor (ECF subfamily)
MNLDYSKYKDADLVAELKLGKENAEKSFAEIYTRYSQRIFAYCLRMTGHQEDAQDAFHETFLKFYDMAQDQKYVEHLSGLLLTIARNICFNKSRNQKVTLNIDEFLLVSNDRGYEEKELLQLISGALSALDMEYREAFILRNYHGLSYQDISQITNESIATVRNRAWRAKEKIKTILAPYLADLSN